MEKEFVTYEQALALKELGFDEPCFGSWEIEKMDKPTYTHSISQMYVNSTHPMSKISAPLKQQAFKWFREKHNLHSYILSDNDDIDWYINYNYRINHYSSYGLGVKNNLYLFNNFKTYEEAENACINRLIELCKRD